MEQLMSDLLRQIAEKMGNLVEVVDEDYGQLDALKNGEPVYPVAFPCVLVGIPETVWGNLKADTQRGEPTLSVRLAFAAEYSRLSTKARLWSVRRSVISW